MATPLLGAGLAAAVEEEERRRREEAARPPAPSNGPWWGSGTVSLPQPGGPWGWGFGQQAKPADYAKPAGAPTLTDDKLRAEGERLKKLREGLPDASLVGVVSDLPGGGWNQGAADAYQKRQPFHTPEEAAGIASRLESAASRYVPWQQGGDDAGTLGRLYQDESARELIAGRFAAENERIDREAEANDPQKRDLAARRLNAAAEELIGRQQGQRAPTLGGMYDRSRPKGWTAGLFEIETDDAGRPTYVNSNIRPEQPGDGRAALAANLMGVLREATEQSRNLPADQRDAYLQQVLVQLGFQGELMGLGKNLLEQVAKSIQAQNEGIRARAEAQAAATLGS